MSDRAPAPPAGRLGPLLVTAGVFTTAFVQWLVVWFFARRFGVEMVGVYSSLYAIATPLFVFVQLGLRDVYLSLQTRYPFRSYVVLRVVGALFGAAVLVGLGVALQFPLPLTLAMALMKIGESVIDLRFMLSQAQQHMVRVGCLMLAYALLMAASVYITTELGGSAELAIAITGVVGLALTAIDLCLPVPERVEDERVEDARAGYRQIVRASLGVMGGQMVLALVASAPILLLRAVGTEAEVGVFAGANYLLTAAAYAGGTLQLIVLPRYRELARAGMHAELAAAARRVILQMLAVGAVVAVIAAVAGDWVLTTVYGEAFALGPAALIPLVIAAVLTVPASIFTALQLTLNAYYDGAIASSVAIVAGVAVGIALVVAGVAPLAAASYTALAAAGVRLPVSLWQIRHRWPRNASTAAR